MPLKHVWVEIAQEQHFGGKRGRDTINVASLFVYDWFDLRCAEFNQVQHLTTGEVNDFDLPNALCIVFTDVTQRDEQVATHAKCRKRYAKPAGRV